MDMAPDSIITILKLWKVSFEDSVCKRNSQLFVMTTIQSTPILWELWELTQFQHSYIQWLPSEIMQEIFVIMF
jgi:hypothetical protein